MTTYESKRQQGVALVVALIFMLILSIIGISSMQGTSIQEKMAGNLRDQYSAFNAAEAALRQGEAQVRVAYGNGNLDEASPLSGQYAASFTAPSVPTWNATVVRVFSTGTSIDATEDGAVVRVTASSAGLSGQSEVRLESIYLVQ